MGMMRSLLAKVYNEWYNREGLTYYEMAKRSGLRQETILKLRASSSGQAAEGSAASWDAFISSFAADNPKAMIRFLQQLSFDLRQSPMFKN